MGNEYRVQIDAASLEEKLRKLEGIKNGVPRATMRAFNKTVAGMKTDAAKEISQRYTVKQMYIKGSKAKEIRSTLEVHKATMNDLSAELYSKGRPLRSIRFQHRANTRPGQKGGQAAYLRVMTGGRRRRLTGDRTHSKAFIATMPNGMQGIFQRTGDIVGKVNTKGRLIKARTGKSASKYAGRKNRENIEEVYSPGVVQMLNNPLVRQKIPEKATERFNKAIDHEIDYLLKK